MAEPSPVRTRTSPLAEPAHTIQRHDGDSVVPSPTHSPPAHWPLPPTVHEPVLSHGSPSFALVSATHALAFESHTPSAHSESSPEQSGPDCASMQLPRAQRRSLA